jgi:hypothetical protein
MATSMSEPTARSSSSLALCLPEAEEPVMPAMDSTVPLKRPWP